MILSFSQSPEHKFEQTRGTYWNHTYIHTHTQSEQWEKKYREKRKSRKTFTFTVYTIWQLHFPSVKCSKTFQKEIIPLSFISYKILLLHHHTETSSVGHETSVASLPERKRLRIKEYILFILNYCSLCKKGKFKKKKKIWWNKNSLRPVEGGTNKQQKSELHKRVRNQTTYEAILNPQHWQLRLSSKQAHTRKVQQIHIYCSKCQMCVGGF